MSDLTQIFYYEVTLSELQTHKVLDKLLLKSQQDVALFLKKIGASKEIVGGGFSYSMTFALNHIWVDIMRLESHKLNFTHKAYSQERGDSLFEVFSPELVVKLQEEYTRFKNYCNDNLEYSDNFRIGVKDCEESMKEFDELCSCCGEFYQTSYIEGFGDIIFGCNYGH